VHRVRVYQNSNRAVHPVAQFVINPESFPENRVDGKEKCSRKNENPFEACDARGKVVANLKPRTAAD